MVSLRYFFKKDFIIAGVIECSPPNIRGKTFLDKLLSIIEVNCCRASSSFGFIFTSLKVFILNFLYVSFFNSSSNNST